MTIGQLIELVKGDPNEFPKGLDTRICIGDVEGNLGVIFNVQVTDHKRGDIVLSVDPHSGDEEIIGLTDEELETLRHGVTRVTYSNEDGDGVAVVSARFKV